MRRTGGWRRVGFVLALAAYGRMNDRDKMLAAELIQWLGSPLGFAFLATAFERAGGRVTFDDYKHNNVLTFSG